MSIVPKYSITIEGIIFEKYIITNVWVFGVQKLDPHIYILVEFHSNVSRESKDCVP